MSFVADQVRRIDGQLDRLQLLSSAIAVNAAASTTTTPRAARLQSLVRALSTNTGQSGQPRPARLRALVEQFQEQTQTAAATATAPEGEDDAGQRIYEQDLEWLVVSKATTQTYGLILQACLGQIINLDDDMWYWNGVLSSARWSSYYTLQTSPARLWVWASDVYREAQDKVARGFSGAEGETGVQARGVEARVQQAQLALGARWRRFYGLVRQVAHERWVSDVQSKVMSPVTRCRNEAEANQRSLGKLRELGASGLGVLIDEALRLEADDSGSDDADRTSVQQPSDEWRSIVSKSVALMETVLLNVTSLRTGVTEFEDLVFSNVDNDSDDSVHASPARPALLAAKLQQILATHLPAHDDATNALRRRYGRPSRLVRYWLPAAAVLLSSSTLLRLFFSHRTTVIEWAQSVAETARDFWLNWVVQPAKKVVGTIRHDEGSEIAIMSKRSLEGDRESLERMVTDFALDHPDGGKGALSQQEAAEIRTKVREGDLTPVLKAYERDLRKPFMGTLRGDLIRALLIQVQKTKVDVEVAMGGIDSLLKSQELVFGFIGLGPGIAVCVGLYQWVIRSSGGRGSRSVSKSQLRMIRVLANIDDILTSSTPGTNGMLSYRDHGLLLCEVHVLRESGLRVFPGELHYDFLKHLGKLTDIKAGVEQQTKVARRIHKMWEQVVLRSVYSR